MWGLSRRRSVHQLCHCSCLIDRPEARRIESLPALISDMLPQRVCNMNYGLGFGGLAGAGFPPANTSSSACACFTGSYAITKMVCMMAPMETMNAKLCAVCKSYTYVVCSKTCLKKDRKLHAKDCREKLRQAADCEKRQEMEERLQRMQEMGSFAGDGGYSNHL